MINSNKKYKIQKINLQISFDKVDRIIDFFRNLRNDVKSIYNQQGGKNTSNKDDKYYKKYKKLLKTSEYSIKYYKNFAQEQINRQMQLNQYYTNLINVLNVQREYLLNEYLKLGKNVKNNKEKINMLETMIDGIEKYMKTPIEFENVVNKIILKGGDMDFNTFSAAIGHDVDLLEKEMLIIKNDKNFVETKIVDLHKRMKDIVEENENLFKIKTEIDWLVKELEYKEDAEIMEAQDFQTLYDKLKTTIDAAQKGSKINEKVASYMHKLEEYASYLENFIKSNKKTIDTIDTQKKPSLEEHIKNAKDKLIGGKMKGGDLAEAYNKILTNNIGNIESYFRPDKWSFFNLNSNLNDNTLKTIQTKIEFNSAKIINLDNDNFQRVIPDFYRQLVTIAQQLELLNKILNNFNLMYNYIGDYKTSLKHDETLEDRNFIKLWNKIFVKKNTDYYNNQILKYKIYFFGNKDILFEDVLKNLVIDDRDKNNFNIEFIFNTSPQNNNEDIIKKIDATIVCMDILYFLLLNFIFCISKMYDGISYINLDEWEKYILQKEKMLIRTGTLVSFEDFDKIYQAEKILVGGDIFEDVEGKTLNSDIVIDNEILLSFLASYTANLIQLNITSTDASAKKEDKKVSNKVNLEQMNKLNELAKMLNRLDDKIKLKLGEDATHTDSYIEASERIGTYEELLNKINENPSQQKGGAVTQPRLTPFKIALINCSNGLQPYVANVNQLKYLISGTRKKDLPMEETIALFSIYTKLKSIVNLGINSYMKVIPMIFFTVEYPPSRYSSEICKFKFTYNETTDIVEYLPSGDCEENDSINNFNQKLKEDEQEESESVKIEEEGEEKWEKEETKKEEIITKEKKLTFNQFYSHAAFLESNNQNGTRKIINDPIIGLGKLLDMDTDKSKPINRVMNIMFALGASGTGKTSRYFGVPTAANPDDKVGIVPYVIEKALTQNASVSDDDKISIAYFVCYGRYESYVLNEVLLFFNIDNIRKNSNSASENNLLYQAYVNNYTDKPMDNLESNNDYTNFYTKLISKKINKVADFNTISGFITKGDEYKISRDETSDELDFRAILEKSDIWYNVKSSDSLSEELKEIFENLLKEQKKINTVVPTKNNIESSRGHTCVLIRIKSDDGTYKYFPLFDMAGTEDPEKMREFLEGNGSTEKMAKLISQINKLGDKITRDGDGNPEVGSLKELVEEQSIQTYLSQVGGAKITATQLVEKVGQDVSVIDGKNFINKIINEGYYINHTIGMIIFAAMCVGESLKTTKTDDNDTFDDFGSELFTNKIINYVCRLSDTYDTRINCHGKPKILLGDLSFDAILNSSSIWTQIIFSFLYWNAETQDSTKNWLREAESNDIKESPYVYDMTNYDFVDNIPIKYAEPLSKTMVNFGDLNSYFSNINNNLNLFENNEFMVSVIDDEVSFSNFKEEYEINFQTQKPSGESVNNKVIIDTSILINNKDSFNELFRQIKKDQKELEREKDKTKDALQKKLNELCPVYIDSNMLKNVEIFKKLVKTLVSDGQDKKSSIDSFAITICKGGGFDNIHKICNQINITLNNIDLIQQQIDQIKSNIDNNLKEFMKNGYILIYEGSNVFFKKNNVKINMKIDEIIEEAKKIPKIQDSSDELALTNQMLRIKDKRITATKMILMHLVTGQLFKNPMVGETISLTKNLYDSTNIQFSKKTADEIPLEEEAATGTTSTGGLPERPQTRKITGFTEPQLMPSATELPSTLPLLRGGFVGDANQLYKEKYLKYREKYLKLKYNIN